MGSWHHATTLRIQTTTSSHQPMPSEVFNFTMSRDLTACVLHISSHRVIGLQLCQSIALALQGCFNKRFY